MHRLQSVVRIFTESTGVTEQVLCAGYCARHGEAWWEFRVTWLASTIRAQPGEGPPRSVTRPELRCEEHRAKAPFLSLWEASSPLLFESHSFLDGFRDGG